MGAHIKYTNSIPCPKLYVPLLTWFILMWEQWLPRLGVDNGGTLLLISSIEQSDKGSLPVMIGINE